MTIQELQARIAEGESLTLEFKRDMPLSDNELVETVVCLANSKGGVFLLGVENNGTISGLHDKRFPVNTRLLQALISNRTIPSITVDIELVEVPEQGTVAVIYVPRSTRLVETDGRAFHRFIAGRGQPECRPLHLHEIAAKMQSLRQFDYSAQTLTQASWQDLSPLEFERIRQNIDKRPLADKALLRLPDEELAKALKFVVTQDDKLIPTVTGILMASKEAKIEEFIPTHEAAFQVIQESRKVVFNERYRSPLVKLFERFEELLQARNDEEEFSYGMLRIGVPLYPIAAFREALANAFIHRDYSQLNAVHVRLDPAEGGLVISNPGGFVEGVTLENLLVIEPMPRNPTLAEAFARIGLVERTGRGIDIIFHEVLASGRSAPDYSGTIPNMVKVVLPGGKADLAFVRLIIETNDRSQRKLQWDDLLILHSVKAEGEMAVSEAARLIQRNESRARALLEELMELGLLEVKGAKRNRTYHLSASIYRRLDKRAAYVRRKGFDELQQEQMIMSYLHSHGRISRREGAELCQVTLRRAEYLLKKLRDRDKIHLVGRGKYAYYISKNPNL
jgi:ATP-dependent DNA helicase RecG